MRTTLSALLAVALALAVGTFNGARAQGVAPGLEPDPNAGNTRVGTRGADFLQIGVGARGLALAGAGASLQPGIFSMYWNPSGLALMEGFGVGFSYAALYEGLDIDYLYAGGAVPFLGGMLGVNWASLSSGEIPRTTEAFPAGGDPLFGPTFEWTSGYVGAFYARRITDRLRLGGGLKFIREGISDASANYVAFDAGVGFVTGLYGIELGAAIQNLGSEGRFDGSAIRRQISSAEQLFPPSGRDFQLDFAVEEIQLPTLFRFTVLLDVLGGPESLVQRPGPHRVNFAIDLVDAVSSETQAAFGVEYGFQNILFGRVGKRFYNEDQRTGDIQAGLDGDPQFFRQSSFRDFDHGLSFGGGLRFEALGRAAAFDYAYVGMGELENVQVFSFEFGL